MKTRCILSLVLLVLCYPAGSSGFVTGPAHAQTENSIGLPGSVPFTTPPPLTFPTGSWPGYASDKIYISPEPPVPGVMAHICAVVANSDGGTFHTATLQFAKSVLGIGMEYTLIGTMEINVPAGGQATGCIEWPNPDAVDMGIQVTLLQDGFGPQISQRNVDAREILQPDVSNDLIFMVRNPMPGVATVMLGMIPHLSGWSIDFSQDTLPSMPPGQILPVTLTVKPPAGVDLPADYTAIVDVQAYVGAEMIGGFRKVFRPPVALHTLPDPVYAEREISLNPYPLETGFPTLVCATLRNPHPDPRDVYVRFAWAPFGIGQQFTPIGGPKTVEVAATSVQASCINWVPPLTGNVGIQVAIEQAGYADQISARNVDLVHSLTPGSPYDLVFPVKNTSGSTATVTLGLVPYLDGWSYELSQDTLPNMSNGQVIQVTVTVTPPAGQVILPVFTPVVDVEGYIGSESIGGIEIIYDPGPLLENFLPLVLR